MPRLAQPFGSTSIEVNKQSIARNFGVKQSEVVYFSAGVVLTGYKVIYDKAEQRAYTLPTGIPAGVTAISLSTAGVLVHSGGNVDLSKLAVTREEYVTLPGSFDTGVIVKTKNELVVFTDGKYRWDGALPKAVPAGSTPSTTGGVGLGSWLSVGDAALRSDLSSAGGVDLVNGAAKESDLNSLDIKVSALYGDAVDIESFSGLVSSGDWTAAIQAALDTGKPVTSSVPNKVYLVSTKLKSKGQSLLGSWKINASHLPDEVKNKAEIPAGGVSSGLPNTIRIMYSSVAWDLCDMLAIKSLGFTMVHSYAGFSGHPSAAGGSVDILLDNCLSAGLLVQLGTEDSISPSNLNITIEQFIQKYDSHPAVWGYSVYDEPGTRRISVADQDAKINKMRPLTKKMLTCVDLIVGYNSPFYYYWSKNYDVFFVNSYAQHYTDGDFTSWTVRDKQKNRIDIGGIKAMSRCAKIVPVVGLFVSTTGQYSRDRDQLITNALFLGKKGGGEYGCFVWDMPWEHQANASVNVSPQFQDACVQLSNQAVTYNLPNTDHYLFGTAPSYADWGIGDILRVVPVKDTNRSDVSGSVGAFPVRRTIGPNVYSGIGFNKASSDFPTTIECRKYVSYMLDAFNTAGMVSGTILRMCSSRGSGDATPLSPDYNLSISPTFTGSTAYATSDPVNKTLTIQVRNSADYSEYEVIVRGIIVCTDW